MGYYDLKGFLLVGLCFFQRPYILIFLLQCELKMDSITLSKKHQPKEELIFRGFTFSAIENALS